MLHNLISQKVEQWFQQPDCPARTIIEHIRTRGFLRDAQIEAIKTYLYLKIEGGNRPLWRLFCDGDLTQSEDLSRLHISEQARALFEGNNAARALFEFSRTKTNGGAKTILPDLEKYLLDHAAEVDCRDVIRRIFYGVEYSDYLFSLPMGAGKTFLMAAFIYLDLYFASNEPDNKIWAHNFLLLVPSGLKSSIIPSLKTIENFDATWVLPEPAASNVKKLIRFEMLDQPKSANKSNKTRSPNSVKVAAHQPFEDSMGLVMVTNAEKVVLDRVQLSAQGVLIEQSADEKENYANELRNLIGKIPNLQILIDEVHHAATDDIKLRQVVNNWSVNGNINGVLGFSGTPYLASGEGVRVARSVSEKERVIPSEAEKSFSSATEDSSASLGMTLSSSEMTNQSGMTSQKDQPALVVKFSQITNTIFYYPLTRAIEGFLKKPAVRTISEIESNAIVRRGVEEFRSQYGTREYSQGQTAKLAIYCGSIERLEEEIYPLLLSMGIAPREVLKYHRGNPKHPAPADAEREWKILDTHLSKKRIILLVQIGKEGWDCRSLTGVVLSQKGDCPTNMVLQTSCRCLRQMDAAAPDGKPETAGIWLNADNAKILDKQLREEQHTSIEEINKLGATNAAPMRPRFSRAEHLRLPAVDFYQMRVQYHSPTIEAANPRETLSVLDAAAFRGNAEVVQSGLKSGDEVTRRFLKDDEAAGELADFSRWLLHISKGSFLAVSLSMLRPFESELRALFAAMTYQENGVRRWSELYDRDKIASRIRLAFHDRRELQSSEEILPRTAHLLLVEKLRDIAADNRLYPNAEEIAQMREMDATGQSVEKFMDEEREKNRQAQQMLKEQGFDNIVLPPPKEPTPAVRHKDRSFQYVPYNFDSSFEEEFLQQTLEMETLRERGLEVYFNGEGELTEFQIECFARKAHGWNRIGWYTPDFLVVQRREETIHRALIVETKGSGFAKEFASRRTFVENEWLQINRDKFGYRRFDFLYLEGKMTPENRFALEKKITEFFTDGHDDHN